VRRLHRPIILVIDRWQVHRAGALRLLRRFPKQVEIEWLPPYSPELNPVEHIWDHLRENDFRNDALQSLDAVADRLGHGLRRLAADPTLVNSLTCFEWINTIRMTAN